MAGISLNHPNLKIFRQHGFLPQGTSGNNQIIGRCPFCGSNKKFFVNPETKKWDCKVCTHNGGYQMFLEQLVSHGIENFRHEKAKALVDKRGISLETFEYFNVGYNPVNETYLIPIWNEKQDELYNIRIYRKDGTLMNSAGCKSALFGWWELDRPYKTIWLCEGEWDAMTMHELSENNDLDKDTIVLAVPGATTFKAEWTGFFSGKIVHVVYDNDYDRTDKHGIFRPGAGKLGMHKVYDNLKGITKSLDFVNWPKFYKDGFDLNDLYKKKKGNAYRSLKQLVSMMKPEPPKIDYPEGQEPKKVKDEKERKKPFTGVGLHYEEVYKAYREFLYLPSTDPIDVAFGTIIANRLPGDPVWTFLVGPSGCGKSEIIMSLDDAPRIYPVSKITPHTLISGSASAGGGDPSLIPRLNEQILTVKDFTDILNMNEQAREAIFGQLRDAYDGKCANEFGTGSRRAYESKFGILAGVTEAIEIYLEGGTAMGERFISYKFPPMTSFAETCKVMSRAMDNQIGESKVKEDMRAKLRETAAKVLDHDFGESPDFPMHLREKMMALAFWIAQMRGTVTRNRFTREIERRAYIESPTRLSIQMTKLSMGLAQFKWRDTVNDDDFELIKKMGRGTAPAHLDGIIKGMYEEDASGLYQNQDIADIMRLPLETCKRFCENLHQLGILRLKKPKGGLIGAWYLSKDFIDIIQLSEVYETKTNRRRK